MHDFDNDIEVELTKLFIDIDRTSNEDKDKNQTEHVNHEIGILNLDNAKYTNKP